MTARWYAAAVLLAVAAVALVFWQLGTSASTACVRNSAGLSPGDPKPKGCSKKAAAAVVDAVRRIPAAKRPTALEVRSALVVWVALFAATAGVAAFAAVRSVATITELEPDWDRRLIGFSAGAVVLVTLPLVLFRVVSQFAFARFGSFDELHQEKLQWLNPLIAVLTMPAVVGLVVVARIVACRPGLQLEQLAGLGSRMRWLVGILGAFLSLAVLTTAGRWQLIGTLPGGESIPAAVVLLWGATFALVLGLLYVPIYQVWAAATEGEIDREVQRQLAMDPGPGGTPGFRAAELALKKELAATLGLGGPLRSLQGSVSVLAPVIAAAVSSLFA